MLTDVGPVEVRVPRDVAGSFEPQIVGKRQRRLTGVDEMVLSLSAKGLTHGEISARLAEVYGAEVSEQTISTITDKVMDGMAEWQNRPLDRVYPVLFVDAINVKIRDGQVANRPIYVVMAVTVDGTRDILGIWAGDGGEGAKYWLRSHACAGGGRARTAGRQRLRGDRGAGRSGGCQGLQGRRSPVYDLLTAGGAGAGGRDREHAWRSGSRSSVVIGEDTGVAFDRDAGADPSRGGDQVAGQRVDVLWHSEVHQRSPAGQSCR
ncbi:hypothetical protein SSP531S_51310 [Streptomyces spongiicola]|uniref:Mutator family transposase n=1 Tax=Streptomyces spongiicola TaxID=1690221 RepID=A0A388T558_9ACTN|nr:hypothetical protein SSP531S_51310 [Streptomyces spongiicola]